MNKSLQSKKPGYATVMVLLAVVILLATGVGLLGLGLNSRTFSIRTASEVAARCAADAGLTKALFEMNEKLKARPWDDSLLPEATYEALPNCDAVFSYTVTGDIDSGYTIESTGICGQSQRSISCTLRLVGPFEPAICGDESISLKNGSMVDGYNYDSDEENLKVGTNSIESGAVDLKNGVIVNGDVVVGVGGDPDVIINATWATITGETYAMTEEYELPPVAVPGWLESLPSKGTIEDSTTTTTITSSGKYDGIDLSNGKIITVDGPVTLYITGDVILKNSAELQVVDDDGVCLTLYLAGGVEVKNSGAVNNLAQDPTKLTIYGLDSCESIILKNGSDFYGAIYAPNADVTFHNSANAYGCVIARNFEQKNSAAFNYDASLRNASTNDECVRFVVKGWCEE